MNDRRDIPSQLEVPGAFIRREQSTFDSLYAPFPGAQVWREWFFAP